MHTSTLYSPFPYLFVYNYYKICMITGAQTYIPLKIRKIPFNNTINFPKKYYDIKNLFEFNKDIYNKNIFGSNYPP